MKVKKGSITNHKHEIKRATRRKNLRVAVLQKKISQRNKRKLMAKSWSKYDKK